ALRLVLAQQLFAGVMDHADLDEAKGAPALGRAADARKMRAVGLHGDAEVEVVAQAEAVARDHAVERAREAGGALEPAAGARLIAGGLVGARRPIGRAGLRPVAVALHAGDVFEVLRRLLVLAGLPAGEARDPGCGRHGIARARGRLGERVGA